MKNPRWRPRWLPKHKYLVNIQTNPFPLPLVEFPVVYTTEYLKGHISYAIYVFSITVVVLVIIFCSKNMPNCAKNLGLGLLFSFLGLKIKAKPQLFSVEITVYS